MAYPVLLASEEKDPTLEDILSAEGFVTTKTDTLISTIQKIKEGKSPILFLQLTENDNYLVLEELARSGFETPVIMRSDLVNKHWVESVGYEHAVIRESAYTAADIKAIAYYLRRGYILDNQPGLFRQWEVIANRGIYLLEIVRKESKVMRAISRFMGGVMLSQPTLILGSEISRYPESLHNIYNHPIAGIVVGLGSAYMLSEGLIMAAKGTFLPITARIVKYGSRTLANLTNY